MKWVFLILFATGCMGHIARALKEGPSIITVEMGSPWGTQRLVRVGGQTNDVVVSANGTITVSPPKK